MKTDFREYGFQYPDGLIMSYIGGSQAHGAKVSGTDDTDWYGVFIEPAEKALGIDRFEHFVTTTGGQPGGNGPQDVDVCLYSLRKWAGLAVKGNPSALHFLFAPNAETKIWWTIVAQNYNLFMAKGHVKAFCGFAHDQLMRLFGEKGQKNIHRAELESEFGYDTKYAMHIIRLYGEAKELMETGKITLPRPNVEELIAIRKGKYKLHELREMGNQLEMEALQASANSDLPNDAYRVAVSRLIAKQYLDFYERQGAKA